MKIILIHMLMNVVPHIASISFRGCKRNCRFSYDSCTFVVENSVEFNVDQTVNFCFTRRKIYRDIELKMFGLMNITLPFVKDIPNEAKITITLLNGAGGSCGHDSYFGVIVHLNSGFRYGTSYRSVTDLFFDIYGPWIGSEAFISTNKSHITNCLDREERTTVLSSTIPNEEEISAEAFQFAFKSLVYLVFTLVVGMMIISISLFSESYRQYQNVKKEKEEMNRKFPPHISPEDLCPSFHVRSLSLDSRNDESLKTKASTNGNNDVEPYDEIDPAYLQNSGMKVGGGPKSANVDIHT